MNRWAVITAGGFVLFTLDAKNGEKARADMRELRKRSDTVRGIRSLKPQDLGIGGAPLTAVPHRGYRNAYLDWCFGIRTGERPVADD